MLMQTRRHRGFVVIDRRDGAPIWGTFRPVLADAWAVYLNNNPQVEGHETQASVAPCEIFVNQIMEGQ